MNKSQAWWPHTYAPGDIVGYKPTGWSSIEGRLNQITFTPHIALLHWFIIGNYIPDENDYVIYESIPSHGVALGRLSWYDKKYYRVFRPNVPMSRVLSERVINDISLFGRQHYGYTSIITMVLAILRAEISTYRASHKLKSIKPSEIKPFMSQHGLLCTQLVARAYHNAGYDVVDDKDAALPAAFINSLNREVIFEVTMQLKGEKR